VIVAVIVEFGMFVINESPNSKLDFTFKFKLWNVRSVF